MLMLIIYLDIALFARSLLCFLLVLLAVRRALESVRARIVYLGSTLPPLDRLDAQAALVARIRRQQGHRAPRHAPTVARGITRGVRRVRALHVRRDSRHLPDQVHARQAQMMVGPPMMVDLIQTTRRRMMPTVVHQGSTSQ